MPKHESDGLNKFGFNADVDIANDADIWDGGIVAESPVYVFPTAARIHNIVSTDPQDSAFALGILTLSANVINTETVTIDSKVYTFQTVLTDVDGNVLIGATASDSIDNLIAAITLGAGSGTTYAASTTLHPTATAIAGAGDTMAAYAKTAGSSGETITTTETSATASWGAATMALGTGARTMVIEGLSSVYLENPETVTLNGLITVASSNSFLRINRMVVKSAGSGGVNAGTISATAVTDSTVSSQISIGRNQTLQAIFTVPAVADLFLTQYYGSIGKATAGSADFLLLIRPFGEVFQTTHLFTTTRNGTGHFIHQFSPRLKVAAKSDIKVRASVGTDAMQVAGGFEGLFSRPATVS